MPYPPAEVNLLVMREEPTVKSAMKKIDLTPYDHACSCRPMYLGYAVILAVVLLNRSEYPATTIGVTKPVDVSASSSGILKLAAVMP